MTILCQAKVTKRKACVLDIFF